MRRSRLGVAADDFGLGPKQGLQAAARIGYAAVELDATRGDVDPVNLSQTGIRHLRRLVDGLGLDLAALAGHFGDSGLTDERTVDERIDKLRQILELAPRLGVPIINAHLGSLPDDPNDRRHATAVEALRHLAEHADKTGTVLAVKSAVGSPKGLEEMLHQIDCPMVRICYDPGGLLIHGYDPISSIEQMGELIASAHLRDATPGTAKAAGQEVRMGSGQVSFLPVLAALEAGQCAGPQIVRRTASADPMADLAAARQYLQDLLR